jgi:hypothetical protein
VCVWEWVCPCVVCLCVYVRVCVCGVCMCLWCCACVCVGVCECVLFGVCVVCVCVVCVCQCVVCLCVPVSVPVPVPVPVPHFYRNPVLATCRNLCISPSFGHNVALLCTAVCSTDSVTSSTASCVLLFNGDVQTPNVLSRHKCRLNDWTCSLTRAKLFPLYTPL